MIRFVEKPHLIRPGATMIEVWYDNKFLAAIYPGSLENPQAPMARVISRYLNDIVSETGADGVTVIELPFGWSPAPRKGE